MTARRPRVLVILDALNDMLGGGERTALRLATDLPSRGYDVWFATTRHASGWPLETLADAGVHHVAAHRSSTRDVRGLAPLWRTLRRESIDVVHAHMHGSNVWGTVLGRLAGTPVVIAHEHTWAFKGQPVRRALDASVGRLADAFIAVSSLDAQRLHDFEAVPRDKVHVIPTAWERRANADEADIRIALGVPPAAPLVGTVAVLRPQKRLDVLLEAFGQVRAVQPDAWLAIVGDGPERGALEDLAKRTGLADRVRFAGHRENVDAVWQALDVAAISSDFEGMPLTVLEALSHGTPIVSTAVGGVPEVLEAGGGVLVPRRDAAALADGIAGLLADPGRRVAIGEAGRRRAEDFTVQRQVDRCVALYEALLRGARARERQTRMPQPLDLGAL